MPNHCENNLTINGDAHMIKKFYDENFTIETDSIIHDSPQLQFSMSVPMPQHIEDWYNWNINNWGTKWEPYEVYSDYVCSYREATTLDINFDTAWSPPQSWLITVATLYPALHFELRYADDGLGFSGVLECQEGEVVKYGSGESGDFYGEKICNNCEMYTEWVDMEDFDKELGVCVCCRDEAFKSIASVIRSKKINQLSKKLACMRMGRNPIIDNFMMRKVFIPRLCDCVH